MNNEHFDWAVIGAGPAGIAAIGKLIDHDIDPKKIAWIDPDFKVGDFGTKWTQVSSNTKVDLFNRFFHEVQSFGYQNSPHFPIQECDPNKTCLLALAAEPLLWISDHLKTQVNTFTTRVNKIQTHEGKWRLALKTNTIEANKVILAIGSEPNSLALPSVKELPLTVALNPKQLAQTCQPEDTIAVFGSSHSAIIIIRNLLEHTPVKKLINFYRSPLRYAVYLEDQILFDDTGLKGTTAEWAREHIDGTLPEALTRVISNPENLNQYLPECTHAIYATGFTRRAIPVEGLAQLKYDDKTGIIAPGFFGFGIAFPEAKIDSLGNLEHRVGLWKFMDYLNRVLPIWLQDSL